MRYHAQCINGVWCVVAADGTVIERCGLGPAFRALAERIAALNNAWRGL